MAGDIASFVSGVGGAVGALFGAEGNAAQAADFTGAANLATQNAQLAAASTRIQEAQTVRSVTQSLGTTQADVAGAGFTMSGSALDLLKSSAQQGSLAASLVNIQGAMNENSYAAQAGAYAGEATAAKEANKAGTVNAIASLGGALLGNAGALVSAGKTVVQGANWLFGGSSGISDAQITAGALDQTNNAVWAGSSLTDSSLGEGASLYDTSVGIDTSGVGLGGAISDVSSAVSSAFSSVGTALSSGVDAIFGAGAGAAIGGALSSFIPGLGLVSLIDMIPGVSDIPVVGPVLDAVSGVISDIGNGIVSVVGDVGSAIGSVFGSVICTALYKRGMLTRSVWYGAQKYGRDIAPPHIYHAYLFWGQPIANTISKHEWFAKLVAPVFVPWAHELAVLAGEKTAKSTFAGRVIFKVTYAFSSALGKCIYKGEPYAART